ncbi:MAG: hypothetical protein NTW20_18425 [Rhodobacterales bacterium]|nr:hypothetical protein [Rhodobacterales bacterium]
MQKVRIVSKRLCPWAKPVATVHQAAIAVIRVGPTGRQTVAFGGNNLL